MPNLSLKIKAVNETHRLLNEAAANALPVLAEFIGSQVRLGTGALSKKLLKKLPLPQLNSTPDNPNTYDNARYTNSNYDISIAITACQQSGENVEYFTGEVQLGRLRDGILTEVSTIQPLRTDWTVEALQLAQEAARKAQRDLNKALTDLEPFNLFTH